MVNQLDVEGNKKGPRAIKTHRMTKMEREKANRFHKVCPVKTMQQLLRIAGKDVINRFCRHLNVNTESRSFHYILKNLENKMRRLPAYKLRYNKEFDEKRLKNHENKPY